MKNITLVAALTTTLAFSAYTAGAVTADIDTDGDGMASLAELQVSNPDLTEEAYLDMDTDGDGFINDEEMAIAIESGYLVDPVTDS